MAHDEGSPVPLVIRPSDACRSAAAALLHELERASRGLGPSTAHAVVTYANTLAAAGLTPEAAVIAFKDTLAMSSSLGRLGPGPREELRASLVSLCIDTYFARPELADAPPQRQDLPTIGRRWGQPPEARA